MWQVQLMFGGGFQVKIFIFRLLNDKGDCEFMYPLEDGNWRIELVEAAKDPKPSLIFGLKDGHAIMRSFAEQLAQHGFSVVDAQGVVKAKELHIKTLEVESERLFELAKRTPLIVKAFE